jgi:hypothetical protein
MIDAVLTMMMRMGKWEDIVKIKRPTTHRCKLLAAICNAEKTFIFDQPLVNRPGNRNPNSTATKGGGARRTYKAADMGLQTMKRKGNKLVIG